MEKTIKNILILITVLSLIGLIDSFYLTQKFFAQSSVFCSILDGCDRVTTSKYASVGSVPIALLGVLYYLFILILGLRALKTGRGLNLIAYASLVGFAVSAWLVYLQVFTIKALCLYCLVSAIISTLIFTTSVFLATKNRSGSLEPER